jgi:hypothetical protein
MAGGPIDGTALVVAAAKASVSGDRLPDLVDRAQTHLAGRRSEYARRYERAHEDETQVVFFVDEGHWAEIGGELALERREWEALRRAHHEHLERLGTELGRREEFSAALELRAAVVVGKR